jgi:hypothetical protein
MNKLTALLLLLPAFAYGNTGPLGDPASYIACYQNLSSNSSKEDLLESISCLKSNPFASDTTIQTFSKTEEPLLAKFQQAPNGAEVSAAMNDLVAQKSHRLYIAFSSRMYARSVLVVDKAYGLVFPRPHEPTTVPIYDLSALNIKFAEKSSILGSDTTVPLQNVKAFSYLESPNVRRIGNLITVHADDTRVADGSYQGEYPIRAYDADGKHWNAISVFSGALYTNGQKIENFRLALDQVSLSTFSVEFLSEDAAKQQIAQVESVIQAKKIVQEQARRVAADQAAIQAQGRAQNLAQMAKAKIGSEDSCHRTDLNRAVVVKDPTAQDVEIECQFGGVINLKGLKDAGWLVVNKQRSDDVVTDYYIRKAR